MQYSLSRYDSLPESYSLLISVQAKSSRQQIRRSMLIGRKSSGIWCRYRCRIEGRTGGEFKERIWTRTEAGYHQRERSPFRCPFDYPRPFDQPMNSTSNRTNLLSRLRSATVNPNWCNLRVYPSQRCLLGGRIQDMLWGGDDRASSTRCPTTGVLTSTQFLSAA